MLMVWQVAKCEPKSAGVRVRGGNASPGRSIFRPTGNVAGRTYVSSISVIAFTSIVFFLFPLPRLSLALSFCTMAASETGQSVHSYHWCPRPDYDRGSDAPWLAPAPAWTRPDVLHWSPTPAHCHPVRSRRRWPPPGYRELLCVAHCLPL